jgi:hypothetical protein
MKTIFLFSFMMFASLIGAQSSAVVTYQWNDAFGHSPTFELQINGGTSVFRHHQQQLEYLYGEGMEITIGKNYFDFWYDQRENKLLETREMDRSVPTHASWEPASLEWEITEETKEYMGYSVQKAVAKAHLTCEPAFEFGNAIAWFAVDLPFSTGPMRYYGLPGLIVELTFTKRGQTCRMVSIDFEQLGDLCWPTGKLGVEVTKAQTFNSTLIDRKALRAYRITASQK